MRKLLAIAVLLLSGLAFGQDTDSFTYSNGILSSVGSAKWAAAFGTAGSSPTVSSNALTNSSGPNYLRYIGSPSFPNNQYSQMQIVTNSASTRWNGVMVRMSTSTTAGQATGYLFECSSTTCKLTKWNAGTSTALQAAVSHGISIANATIKLTVSGTTLTPLLNGSTPAGFSATYTDSALASGSPGFSMNGAINADNWEGTTGIVQTATPSISPATGTYAGIQSVTITDSTSGATICYTVDGSTPTANGAGTCTNGTTYSGAFNVGTVNTNTAVTVKAIASKSGNSDSPLATSAITTQYGPAPSITPAAGLYYAQQTITITCSSGSPYYTTDGTTPTTSSTLYTGTFSGTASGTQTIKAVCADSTHAAGPVTSNAYTIILPDFTPSDVTVFTSNFSDVYDTNLALNSVQQKPLDYGPTKGKWTAFGGITGSLGVALTPDNAIAAVPSSICTAVAGAYCVASTSIPIAAIYTGKTGLDINQFAETKSAGLGTSASIVGIPAGPCVRMSGNNAYCASIESTPTGVSTAKAVIYKITSGTWVGVADSGPVLSFPYGSIARLRVSQNALQVLIGGSVVLSYTDTSSPFMTGTCGIGSRGGMLQSFTCGNIGTADATTPVSLTYPTYTDAAMSTSSWTTAYPWFQATIPTTPAGGPFWFRPFAANQISGSLYGIGSWSGTLAYRGGLFGSNQWQRFKTASDPDNATVDNYFAPIHHNTFVPGSGGGCAAAGTTSVCYDSASIYPGVETMRQLTAQSGATATCTGVGGVKTEYICTPHAHVTYVSPTSTDDAVLTAGGSMWAVRKGDEWLTIYLDGKLSVACKGSAANEVAWQANHAYTVGTWILDSNRIWQRVKTAGTSASSQPVWYAGWTAATNSGETTNDGTVVWESYGYACPTTSMFSWVDGLTNLDLPQFVNDGGVPALWAQSPGMQSPIFYDWSAGTATATTACELDANLCTMGAPERVRSWEQY